MTELNRTWKNCLRMWKWVSENLPEGFSELSAYDQDCAVTALKRRWLADNKFTKQIFEDCFFCEYDEDRKDGNNCSRCPGKLVDSEFGCNEEKGNYDWATHPKAFYRKLLELDAKRKKS